MGQTSLQRIICFSNGSSVSVRWNPKESHRSADPADVVLSVLFFPETVGTLTIFVLNVIFCPLKMDKMLVSPVQGRMCNQSPPRICHLE